MTRFPLLLLCLFCLAPLPAHAQADRFAPLDPDVIFAEGVEVVDVRYETAGSYHWTDPVGYYNAMPEVRIHNDQRTIELLNTETGEWEGYAYAPAIDTLESVVKQHDGTYLFNQSYDVEFASYRRWYQPLPVTQSLWLFDPEAEQFSPAQTLCGGFARRTPPLNAWVVYPDAQVDEQALCDTATGDIFTLLQGDEWFVVGISPDNEWGVIGRYIGNFQDELFSVERRTGQMRSLGVLDHRDYLYIDRWANNRRGYLYNNDMPESLPKGLYSFEVDQESSLEFVMTGWAEYQDDPPRYEYLQTFWEVAHRAEWGASCELQVYDVANETLSEFTLDSDCFGRVERREDEYFFVGYGQVTDNHTFYSFDTETETKEVLYESHQLLGLDSMSPNGRYAILFMNDGTYETHSPNERPLDLFDPFYYRVFNVLGTPSIIVFDLEHQSAIAELGVTQGHVEWIGNSAFVIVNPEVGDSALRLFTIGETGVEAQSYSLYRRYWEMSVSPSNNLLLLQNRGSRGQVIVFSLAQSQFIPILTQPQDGYRFMQAEWSSDTLIDINFAHHPPTDVNVTYTIRVPTA